MCDDERTEQWETALRNQLSQARDGNAVLHDQLVRLQHENQRLRDEHRQSALAASTLERELVALKADLVQERETAAWLTRESPTWVSIVRETTRLRPSDTPADGAIRVLGVSDWVSVRRRVVCGGRALDLMAVW